ncbi:MAG: AAA family ATPase, partial [Candidatus Lokiarchaeota archaeon]|nr:AAA family ATPase [Candidatus Lokiarchaeota archaeon]
MPNISRNSTIGQEILKHNQPAVHKLFSEDLKYPKFKEIIEKYWKNEISLKIHQVKRLHGELFILNKVNQQNPFLYVPEDEIIDLLDEEQREYAFNLKEGHRILLGCAGSGKTIVLIRRVQYLAEIHKNWKILVLCYNSLLNNMLKTFINSNSLSPAKITIRTFHSWAKWVIESIPEFKIKYGEEWERSKYSKKEKDIFFEEKVPVMLNEVLQIKEDSGNPLLYDAILIDEGQDFHSDWYKLVLRTLKNPEEGSLFIAYDGLQGIYRKEGVSWKSLGIKASGRTKKLPNSYRNSKRVG